MRLSRLMVSDGRVLVDLYQTVLPRKNRLRCSQRRVELAVGRSAASQFAVWVENISDSVAELYFLAASK